MLDIHSEIIHEIFFNELCNHIWILTISIEFHSESSRLDGPTKIWKISVDGWLPSTDRYPIKYSNSPIKEIIKYFLGDMSGFISYNLIWYYHLRIMTISATKIASSGKYYCCNMARIVDECTLLESCDYHFLYNYAPTVSPLKQSRE